VRFSFSGAAPLTPLQHITGKKDTHLGGGNSNIFQFSPQKPWGNDPIQFDLRIFFKKGLIQTTTERATFFCFL